MAHLPSFRRADEESAPSARAGVYTTSAEAAAGLATAHSHGFPDAYVARVTHG